MAAVRLNILSMLMVALMLAPITATAVTINVPEDYQSIQEAIDSASNGDVVLVQPGIYNESIDFDGKAITVASRFIESGEQEDIQNTILDGEGLERSLAYFQHRETNETILDGFTLRNADGNIAGAVHIAFASPTLRNMMIRNNIAGQHGGGILISLESHPIIQNVTLSDNQSEEVGGGIACYSNCTATLINVNFVENRAADLGGGLFSSGSELQLTNVDFLLNSAENNGGGAHFTDESQVTGENITVLSNSSFRSGGFSVLNGSVVTIENVEISNNQAVDYGGGIQMNDDATLLLSNFILSDNIATDQLGNGGGLSAIGNFEAILSNGQIENNVAVFGSAINTETGTLTFDHVLIHDNNEQVVTSVIHLDSGAQLNFNHVTWLNNIEPIQCLSDVNISVENSIIWEEQIFSIIRAGCQISISYSDLLDEIQNNREEFIWGEGILNVDPMFIDPDNADYHLDRFSPCINVGNPESDPDIDGTVADLGYAPYVFNGVVFGVLTDMATGEPIEGVTVSNLHNLTTVSNENGAYHFAPLGPGQVNLLFTKQFYNTYVLEIEGFEENEERETNIEMSHGVFSSDPLEISTDVEPGDRIDLDLALQNTGEGFLAFDIEKRLRGEYYLPLWENSLEVNLSEPLDDQRLYGVALANDQFYIAGSNEGEPAIYVLNRDLELLETLPQPGLGESRYGMRDLCWDGELLWGVMDDLVLGFTTEMEVRHQFETRFSVSPYITVNTETNTLYTCGTTSDIYEYTFGGELINTIERQNLRIYGLGWFANDEDGMPLYISAKIPEYHQVYKMNPNDGELVEIEALRRLEGDGMGIFITGEFLPRNDVLLTIFNNGSNDMLTAAAIRPHTDWMQVNLSSGVIEPHDECWITLSLDASGIDSGIWEGDLVVNHPDAPEGQTVIPVQMNVNNQSAQENAQIPASFGLKDIYPNPFNSTVKISFNVASAQDVSLAVYDLSGRLVKTLLAGEMSAGVQSVVWNADDLATGTYICRLSGENSTQMRKMVLLK